MSNLKNIVVLKDLPSNVIDEALLILKPNSKVKAVEYTPKAPENKPKTNDYIIKEAELLISNYISKCEKSEKKKLGIIEEKYKKLKKLTIALSILLASSIIINLI